MPLYEHVFLARQDASTQQVEELTAQMTGIVEGLNGGTRPRNRCRRQDGRPVGGNAGHGNRPVSLAILVKILINRASVDPGRELNGRSQQSHLSGDVDVAGPVGPSSRASAF